MNKLFNNKHGKVFLHPSQQVQWELHHMYLQATLKKKKCCCIWARMTLLGQYSTCSKAQSRIRQCGSS